MIPLGHILYLTAARIEHMPPLNHNLYLIASGFAGIAEGVIMVLSLGFCAPQLSYGLMMWHMAHQPGENKV